MSIKNRTADFLFLFESPLVELLFLVLYTVYMLFSGLITFVEPHSDSDPILDSWDWNLNLIPCSMENSA